MQYLGRSDLIGVCEKKIFDKIYRSCNRVASPEYIQKNSNLRYAIKLQI